MPGTNLGTGVVNPEAIVGILGQYAPAYMQQLQGVATGEAPAELTDAGHIEYAALAPEHIVTAAGQGDGWFSGSAGR